MKPKKGIPMSVRSKGDSRSHVITERLRGTAIFHITPEEAKFNPKIRVMIMPSGLIIGKRKDSALKGQFPFRINSSD